MDNGVEQWPKVGDEHVAWRQVASDTGQDSDRRDFLAEIALPGLDDRGQQNAEGWSTPVR